MDESQKVGYADGIERAQVPYESRYDEARGSLAAALAQLGEAINRAEARLAPILGPHRSALTATAAAAAVDEPSQFSTVVQALYDDAARARELAVVVDNLIDRVEV